MISRAVEEGGSWDQTQLQSWEDPGGRQPHKESYLDTHLEFWLSQQTWGEGGLEWIAGVCLVCLKNFLMFL